MILPQASLCLSRSDLYKYLTWFKEALLYIVQSLGIFENEIFFGSLKEHRNSVRLECVSTKMTNLARVLPLMSIFLRKYKSHFLNTGFIMGTRVQSGTWHWSGIFLAPGHFQF